MSKPIIVTITGPSGSGKSTLAKALTDLPLFVNLISHTTRKPRVGEIDGTDYVFTSEALFKKGIDEGTFIEHVNFSDNFYGMSKDHIVASFESGLTPVLVVEPNGLRQIDNYCSANGIQLVSLYLENRIGVLIDRVLTRDCLGKEITSEYVKYLSTRLTSLVTREVHWYNQFDYSKYISGYGTSYSNEDVLVEVLNHVVLQRRK